MQDIIIWASIMFLGYSIKIVAHIKSTKISHNCAFSILENIRIYIADKLIKSPLGVTQNKSVGKLKNIIIDQIETIELPIAHFIQEGFACVVQPYNSIR